MVNRYDFYILSNLVHFVQYDACKDGEAVQAVCTMIINFTGLCVKYYVAVLVKKEELATTVFL
jgi:hypothetical protein